MEMGGGLQSLPHPHPALLRARVVRGVDGEETTFQVRKGHPGAGPSEGGGMSRIFSNCLGRRLFWKGGHELPEAGE